MSRIIKSVWLLVIGLLFSAPGFGQSIKGTVKDSSGKPVPYATINLKNAATNNIINYTITDTKGAYILPVPADTPVSGLLVEVRCIGYKNQSRGITDLQAPVDFTLSVSINHNSYSPD